MSGAAKILVVDDTPQNVKLLADILTAKGYVAITAASGEEALTKLAADPPALILLDIMMPGLSGYDVCKRVRADPATALLPIVLVTSLDPQQERIKGIEAGADDFVQKPFNHAELLARVRSLLRIKTLQDEVARQAGELREWNATLEARVRESVTAIESLSRLKQFFSPSVAEAIVSSGTSSLLAPHRRDICAVFTDLRGFTSFTDGAEPEEVMVVLQDFLNAMGRLIDEHEGTVPHFAGDGILIFFNDPLPVPDACARAARMALAMQSAFVPLRSRWQKLGYALDLGIGIARGFATLGAVGYEGRVDYSAIGSVVNLAARLCGEAQGGQTLLDRRASAGLPEGFEVEQLAPLTLKGFDKPVAVFSLNGATGVALATSAGASDGRGT
ncbi:MAG TPA: response regulator [Casimicrobiaceae bacterium]|nr:response regulator [Casimicrobiaceae bacterium]